MENKQYLCLCWQRSCSGLRQKSGRHQAWPQLFSRLLLQPWASAFTLCTIPPDFNIEKSDLEKRQKIRSNVCGGLGQHLLFHRVKDTWDMGQLPTQKLGKLE